MYGDSAGQLPSQVRSAKLATRDQNRRREIGEKLTPLKTSLDVEIENKKRKATASTKPTTPPSLLGMERRIA